MSDALFCALLKFWRRKRGLSQLDLALTAGVSARHLSFLESGRARPSEEMVLRLMSVLAVPLREQNEVLRAAAFPPRFPELGLEALPPPLDFALTHMLRQHAPYPMTVMNAGYEILRANPAAEAIFGRFLAKPEHWAGPLNLLALVFDPQGVRPFIENWASVAQQLLIRLHREALQVYAAQPIQHPDAAKVAYNLGMLLIVQRRPAEALTQFEFALARLRATLGDDHPDAGAFLTGVGVAQTELGRHADAAVTLQSAVDVFERRPRDIRYLAAARIELARALWDSGADRSRAGAQAQQAADSVRDRPEAAGILRDAESWLAEHPLP